MQQFSTIQANVDAAILRCTRLRREVPAQVQTGTTGLLELQQQTFTQIADLLNPLERGTDKPGYATMC